MAVTESASELRFVDADGHILEPPADLQDYAPPEFRERIWHVETDAEGHEWVVAEGHRVPAAVFSLAGVAGYSEEDKARALAGEFTYSEVSRRAWDPKCDPRLPGGSGFVWPPRSCCYRLSRVGRYLPERNGRSPSAGGAPRARQFDSEIRALGGGRTL